MDSIFQKQQDDAKMEIEYYENSSPDIISLALLASPARKIELELLRRLRLELADNFILKEKPHVGTESALWFSSLVESRGADSITLLPEVLHWLRHRLKEKHDTLLEKIRQIILDCHQTVPPVIAWEEDLVYYSLASDGTDEYRELVHETVLKAAKLVQTREGKGLDEWINRMYVRVPRELSENTSFQALLSLSQQQIIKTTGLGNTNVKPLLSGDVILGIKRFENNIEIGKNIQDADFQIDVPKVFPVNLIVSNLINSQQKVCTITETETVLLDYLGGEKSFTLQTLDGRIYKIPEQDESTASAFEEDVLTRLLDAAVLEKSTSLSLTPEHVGKKLTDEDFINLIPKIRQMKNLTILDLSSNQITDASFLKELKSLTSLNLSNNEIIDYSFVKELNSLIWLDLSFNEISNISFVKELTSLTSLDLSNNKIRETSFLKELKSLTWLNLSNNQIRETSFLRELTSLTSLYLSSNQISDVSFLRELTSLKNLNLRNNEGLRDKIPEEILNDTSDAQKILNYIRKTTENEVKPLNEAKIVVVGEADFGKTLLIRRLIYDDYVDTRSTTGIKIERWENVRINNQNVQLNVWDFGGQEIMHSTHQFFFTKRTIYILVIDARQNEDKNKTEEWLKRIESFGGDSPIIIVGSHVDQNQRDSSQIGQGYFDIDRDELKKNFKNIKGFYGVCSDTRVRGFDDLFENFRKGLLAEVGKLEGLHQPFPKDWFSVKDQLERMKQEEIPFISERDYFANCIENQIRDKTSQDTVRKFLNDIGTIIYFEDLSGRMILNPEWITNGVYAIVDNPQIILNKGELEISYLTKILGGKGYNTNEHKFILDLMKKFELCVEIEPNQRFLIPDLLLKVERQYTGDWENTLGFQYHYETYLKSIFTRFVVRMYPLIHEKTWWKNGLVLEHEGSQALVVFDATNKKVIIKIKGDNIKKRQNLLAIIRKEFKEIHSKFAVLPFNEYVAHPTIKLKDEKGREVEILKDYEELRGILETGGTNIFVKELKEYLPISDWLEGVDDAEVNLRSSYVSSFGKLSEEFQNKLEEIRSRKTNFIFLFGRVMSGKTSLIASFIHYLSTVSKYGNLERVGEQKDWRLIEDLRYQFGKGQFPNRTPIGHVNEMNVRFSPNRDRKRLSDLYLTFLDISGEYLREIQTIGEFPENVDMFFKVENISLTFILMTRFDEAREDDYLISSFLDYLSSRSSDKSSNLQKSKFLLLVSNWDNYSGIASVGDFVSKNMPITLRKIRASGNAIREFSVGKVSERDGLPFIEDFDVKPTEAIFAWLYTTLTGKELTSTWERFRKFIFFE